MNTWDLYQYTAVDYAKQSGATDCVDYLEEVSTPGASSTGKGKAQQATSSGTRCFSPERRLVPLSFHQCFLAVSVVVEATWRVYRGSRNPPFCFRRYQAVAVFFLDPVFFSWIGLNATTTMIAFVDANKSHSTADSDRNTRVFENKGV